MSKELSSIEAWKSVPAFRRGFELGLKGIRRVDDGGYTDAFDQAAFTHGNNEGFRRGDKLPSTPQNEYRGPRSRSLWARFNLGNWKARHWTKEIKILKHLRIFNRPS
jgi:hypothetical protein